MLSKSFSACSNVAAGLLALSAVGAGPAAASQPARAEPIVLMDGGSIAACGVRAIFGSADKVRVFELLVRRVGEDTVLTIRGQCPWRTVRSGVEGAEEIPITRPALATASAATDAVMKGPPARTSDFVELSAEAGADKIAPLIQELMIGGGSFTCMHEWFAPDATRYELPGPLSQQVRAAYLNCAGDLFRPEEEEARRRRRGQ